MLDLSRVLAGPFATQLLGDLGAEIIKIEKPGEGDETREFGPPFVPYEGARGDAAYFLAANRNKKSVAIDFSTPRGSELIRRLAECAHVVVENFKTGTLERYGLDYQALARRNPGLIYCSVTGFGHTGPYRSKAGYDSLIQGMAGLMSITGQADGTPGAEPMKVGVAVSDLITGLYAVAAIQAALIHQARTGEGQSIDMALFDCQAAALANQALSFLAGGVVPVRLGNAHPNIVPYQVFSTTDGYFILAVANDGQFRRFCEAAGLDRLANDPRYATNAERVSNRQALVDAVQAAVSKRTTAEWITVLEAANVPCGPINRIDEVFDSEQARVRGLRTSMAYGIGSIDLLGCPLQLQKTPPEYRTAPPLLGQHTREVLSNLLDVPDGEIEQLVVSRVIAVHEDRTAV